MQLSKEQIQSILDDAKPSIIEGLKNEVVNQAKWEMNPVVSKMITDVVTQFMNDEIIPVIKKQLVEEKEGLISVATSSVNTMTIGLGECLAATLKKNLESSYQREKILKSLFD